MGLFQALSDWAWGEVRVQPLVPQHGWAWAGVGR